MPLSSCQMYLTYCLHGDYTICCLFWLRWHCISVSLQVEFPLIIYDSPDCRNTSIVPDTQSQSEMVKTFFCLNRGSVTATSRWESLLPSKSSVFTLNVHVYVFWNSKFSSPMVHIIFSCFFWRQWHWNKIFTKISHRTESVDSEYQIRFTSYIILVVE